MSTVLPLSHPQGHTVLPHNDNDFQALGEVSSLPGLLTKVATLYVYMYS